MLGFNLWGRGVVPRNVRPEKPEQSWNLAGTLLKPSWNLAGTLLKPSWNLAYNLAGTLLEPSWNRYMMSNEMLELYQSAKPTE